VAGAIVAAVYTEPRLGNRRVSHGSQEARATIAPARVTMSTRAPAFTKVTVSTKTTYRLPPGFTCVPEVSAPVKVKSKLLESAVVVTAAARNGHKSGRPGQWLFGRPEFQRGPVDPDDVVRRGHRRGSKRAPLAM
jgi:hypothetical protein